MPSILKHGPLDGNSSLLLVRKHTHCIIISEKYIPSIQKSINQQSFLNQYCISGKFCKGLFSQFSTDQSTCALLCLNIGTPKTINFPFGTNGKLMVLGVPIRVSLKFGISRSHDGSIINFHDSFILIL